MMGICYLFEVDGVFSKPCLDMCCRLCNACIAGSAASQVTLKMLCSAEMCALAGRGRGRVSVALKGCTAVCPFGWSHSGCGRPLCSGYEQEYKEISWVIFAGER